jgi:hypothetical protein
MSKARSQLFDSEPLCLSNVSLRALPLQIKLDQGTSLIGEALHTSLDHLELPNLQLRWVQEWLTLKVEHFSHVKRSSSNKNQAIQRLGKEQGWPQGRMQSQTCLISSFPPTLAGFRE